MSKNGNKVGSKIWNQSRRPDLAPEKTAFGKTSMIRNKNTIPSPDRFRFVFIRDILESFIKDI